MKQIADAPWVRDPERYEEEYYGKPVYVDDEDEGEDEFVFAGLICGGYR